MFYQWGRKDPFIFPTNSTKWGDSFQTGKYPVKIYTIDGVLIYQEETGRSNKDKQPAGGIILSTLATSIMETIKNPITFYYNPIINQSGHTKEMWDYYWTSYSRGVDGDSFKNIPKRHNNYLDGYSSQRLKSTYDPCPYGYRVPSNGVYNQLVSNPGWTWGSYAGTLIWGIDNTNTLIQPRGWRTDVFRYIGVHGFYSLSTTANTKFLYSMTIAVDKTIWFNHCAYDSSNGMSVRCIEDCERRLSSQHLPCGTNKLAL